MKILRFAVQQLSQKRTKPQIFSLFPQLAQGDVCYKTQFPRNLLAPLLTCKCWPLFALLTKRQLWILKCFGSMKIQNFLPDFPLFWPQSDTHWSMASLNRAWPYNPFIVTYLLLAVSQRGHLLLPYSPCPECRPQSQWNALPCIVPVRRTRRGVSPLGWQNSLGAVKKQNKNQEHINLPILCPKVLGQILAEGSRVI